MSQTDQSDIEYKGSDLSLLNVCAAYILYKRYALAAWREFNTRTLESQTPD